VRLGAEFEDGVGHLLGAGVGDEGESALGEDVESEVAAAFGPFVGLLGEDGADEPSDRVTVGLTRAVLVREVRGVE